MKCFFVCSSHFCRTDTSAICLIAMLLVANLSTTRGQMGYNQGYNYNNELYDAQAAYACQRGAYGSANNCGYGTRNQNWFGSYYLGKANPYGFVSTMPYGKLTKGFDFAECPLPHLNLFMYSKVMVREHSLSSLILTLEDGQEPPMLQEVTSVHQSTVTFIPIPIFVINSSLLHNPHKLKDKCYFR